MPTGIPNPRTRLFFILDSLLDLLCMHLTYVSVYSHGLSHASIFAPFRIMNLAVLYVSCPSYTSFDLAHMLCHVMPYAYVLAYVYAYDLQFTLRTLRSLCQHHLASILSHSDPAK